MHRHARFLVSRMLKKGTTTDKLKMLTPRSGPVLVWRARARKLMTRMGMMKNMSTATTRMTETVTAMMATTTPWMMETAKMMKMMLARRSKNLKLTQVQVVMEVVAIVSPKPEVTNGVVCMGQSIRV